jgi:hypothetical protein
MPGLQSGFRGRIFKAVHAEALRRKIDHDALHDLCTERFGVHSMSDVTDGQLLSLYREWTGKTLRNRSKLPSRGWEGDGIEMVSGEELIALAQEFAKRQLGPEGQRNFIRRQLRGRDEMRTRKDFVRVLGGIRAMNRRDGK